MYKDISKIIRNSVLTSSFISLNDFYEKSSQQPKLQLNYLNTI